MNKQLQTLIMALTMIGLSCAHAAKLDNQLATIAIDDIDKTKALKAPAIALGKKVYQANCVSCHGANLKGVTGQHVPDLTDNATLYTSDNVDANFDINEMFASDFETTVKYGIRADHPKTRKLAFMPSFAGLNPKQEGGYPVLPDNEISDLTEYLLSVSGQQADKAAAARGQKLFTDKDGCYDCHGNDAEGNGSIGGTDFTQQKNLLYGSDRTAITASIREGRHGMCPAYENKLNPAEIKAVSYYLFSVQKNVKPLTAKK